MQAAAEPKIIGVLGMGAMGAGVAGDLRASGFRVLSVLSGRSERSRQRAGRAGIEPMPDLATLLAQCDTFLSIVPADQAEPLAEAVAGSLGGRPIHYVDCNSITPSKAARIARRLEAAGATYSDGGIIGPPATLFFRGERELRALRLIGHENADAFATRILRAKQEK